MRKISPLTYLEEEAPPLQLGPVCRLSMQYHFQKVQPLLNIFSRKSNHDLTLFLSGTKHISSLLAIEVSLGGLVYVLNNLPFFYCVCDNIGAAQINSNMYWDFDSNHEAGDSDKCVTIGKNKGGGKINPWGPHFPNSPLWETISTGYYPGPLSGWFKIMILGRGKKSLRWNWKARFRAKSCILHIWRSEGCSSVSWDAWQPRT